MHEFLTHYEPINPATWGYVSSLMMIGLFFKFGRFWSLRNVDLIGLILLTPGLLLVVAGERLTADAFAEAQKWGYLWLFIVGGLFMLRMLADSLMVRRPLLEPNLSVGGMTFVCAALFIFLTANVLTGLPEARVSHGARDAARADTDSAPDASTNSFARHGPGFPPLFEIPRISTRRTPAAETDEGSASRPESERIEGVTTAKLLAIFSQLALLVAMVLIGYRHFENYRAGIAAATLYLMLPYAATRAGYVEHVLPAALLAWTVFMYRRPLIAGMLLGLAAGVIYYPLYLLPLWIAFYWRRGCIRFVISFAVTLGAMVGLLAIMDARAGTMDLFAVHLRQMFGWTMPVQENLRGFWNLHDPTYRIPVLAAFVALAGSLALWPARKSLGTLLSCSAAVMLGTQFWHAHEGGLYMAWYMPLLLMTIFRPNLENRVALTVLRESRRARKRAAAAAVEKAA